MRVRNLFGGMLHFPKQWPGPFCFRSWQGQREEESNNDVGKSASDLDYSSYYITPSESCYGDRTTTTCMALLKRMNWVHEFS